MSGICVFGKSSAENERQRGLWGRKLPYRRVPASYSLLQHFSGRLLSKPGMSLSISPDVSVHVPNVQKVTIFKLPP